jgi:hypothetical protein
VRTAYTNVIHQVMQRCFHRIQFRLNTRLTNLTILLPAPASDFILDLVE